LLLDIPCVTYFLISITLPDALTSDRRQIGYIGYIITMSALPVASARLS